MQSIEVEELPYDPVVQIMDQQINHRIEIEKIKFGQTIPCFTVNKKYWITVCKWFGMFLLILAAIIGYYYRVGSNASLLNIENILVHDTLIPIRSDGNDQVIAIREEDKCFCPNGIVMNDEVVHIVDEIISSFTYDEPNIENMFKETSMDEVIDESTCKLDDKFSYVFTQLCSLKDNIIARIPPEPPDDIYSIYDSTKKIESSESFKTIDQLFVSSIEYADLTDTHIGKETNPVYLEEECV